MRRWTLLAACLAGCATGQPRDVRFSPRNSDQERLAAALEAVYVVVEEPRRPKPPPAGLIGHMSQKFKDEALGRVPAEDLARAAAKALRAAGAWAAVYRVAPPNAPDPYPALLGASSVLRLQAGEIEVSSEKRIEAERRNKKGNVTAEKIRWILTGRLRLDAALADPAAGERLSAFSVTGEASADVWQDGAPDTAAYKHRMAAELMSDCADRLAKRFALPAEARSSRAPDERRPGWDWFEPRLAVLPFTDATTSIDGPAAARKTVQAELAEGGYSAIPLGEVDAALKAHGITMGGQLAGAAPEELARWLNAERLVFANLKYYQKVPSLVAGSLSIWEAKSRRKASVTVEATQEETLGAEGVAELRRVSGLSAAAAARLPANATLRFARRALASLPRRAPAR